MGKIKVENNAKNVLVKIEENGKKIIIEQMSEQMELSEIKPGEKFKVGEFVFKKLYSEIGEGCILDEFIDDGDGFKFGDSNNYAESKIRKYLNGTFYRKLVEVVGEDNIYKHTVDLTSEDGLKDYKSCQDKVSLLTERRYQIYREHLPNTGKRWWLATPYSTEGNGYSRGVCVVRGGGALGSGVCGYGNAVRPFCIFAPCLLVSRIDE